LFSGCVRSRQHLLQTAEAIRRDGHPRWFILTGLIHDLGKILCLWGEPQWAVVGDTNPGACRAVRAAALAANADLVLTKLSPIGPAGGA